MSFSEPAFYVLDELELEKECTILITEYATSYTPCLPLFE